MWSEMLAEAARAAQGPDPAAARVLVDRLLAQAPRDGDALTLSGIVAQRTGRTDDAIRAFRAACDADPGDAGRYQNLAVALKRAGAFEEALGVFAKALELRPGHAPTLVNLGSCLIDADRCEAALDVLDQALARAPDHADALNNAGVALARLGRHEEACARYRRALAVRPDHAETTLNLVDALGACHHAEEAAALAAQVLRTAPGHLRAANQLGLLREGAGDYAGAVAALRPAFDPAAPHHALGVNLARVLIRAGRQDDALAVCDALIATQPSVTTPLALALAALDHLGREDERASLMALDRFVLVHDFESVPGFSSLASFNAQLVEELRAHPSLTFEPEGLVTRQGRQSADLADASEPALRQLARMARDRLGAALERFAQEPADHSFLRALPREWSLTMWGTILRPGGEVGPHIHAPNWLSGVYYPEFESTAEDGAFAIGVLPKELDARDLGRGGGGGNFAVRRPRAGRMILFPSYLWHATLPFAGDAERISLAFDLVPAHTGQPHRLK